MATSGGFLIRYKLRNLDFWAADLYDSGGPCITIRYREYVAACRDVVNCKVVAACIGRLTEVMLRCPKELSSSTDRSSQPETTNLAFICKVVPSQKAAESILWNKAQIDKVALT